MTYQQNASLHRVLSEFHGLGGVSVLCHTSLNINGAGVIYRTSDLANYAREAHLDGFVVEDRLYMRKSSAAATQSESS